METHTTSPPVVFEQQNPIQSLIRHWKINASLIPAEIQAYTEQIRKEKLLREPEVVATPTPLVQNTNPGLIHTSTAKPSPLHKSAFSQYSKEKKLVGESKSESPLNRQPIFPDSFGKLTSTLNTQLPSPPQTEEITPEKASNTYTTHPYPLKLVSPQTIPRHPLPTQALPPFLGKLQPDQIKLPPIREILGYYINLPLPQPSNNN